MSSMKIARLDCLIWRMVNGVTFVVISVSVLSKNAMGIEIGRSAFLQPVQSGVTAPVDSTLGRPVEFNLPSLTTTRFGSRQPQGSDEGESGNRAVCECKRNERIALGRELGAAAGFTLGFATAASLSRGQNNGTLAGSLALAGICALGWGCGTMIARMASEDCEAIPWTPRSERQRAAFEQEMEPVNSCVARNRKLLVTVGVIGALVGAPLGYGTFSNATNRDPSASRSGIFVGAGVLSSLAMLVSLNFLDKCPSPPVMRQDGELRLRDNSG